MKKLIPILLAALAVTACEKDPDTGKLDSKYLVYTNYDKQADFKAYSTFYLPDSILLIGDSKEPEYWKDESATMILNTYSSAMEGRGYVRTANRDEADLGLQVSYVKSTYYLTDYSGPEWWWGYPGYWDAPYWGNWGGGWYYPYVVSYTYSTGSYLTELLNLNAPQGEREKLPVLWTAYMTGILSDSATSNLNRALDGITQAFTQSPYLTNR